MDELDLLKKDWKRQEANIPKFHADEIQEMLKKRSSSLVKWIFIVSVIEFAFWIGLEIFSNFSGYNKIFVEAGVETLANVIIIINYAVILGFIAIFFYNYQKIKITDDAKRLMKKILITRKTVKCYVWFNIIYFAISFIIMNYFVLTNTESLEGINMTVFIGVIFGVMLIFIAILLLFYRLVYGILTRKLYKNYKELKNLELE